MILYELYGFVLPALSPSERRAVRPLLTAIPFLFVAGVLFGYFVVMPAAIHFLQNFNSDEFNVLVQANQYYRFAATVLLAMGLVFQVPVVIVGRDPRRARHPATAAPRPPLRDRGVRGGRRLPAGGRGHTAAGDGAAVRALRGEYPGGGARGASRGRAGCGADGGHGRARRPAVLRRGERQSAAPAAGPDGPPSAAVTGGQDTDPGVSAIIDHIDRKLSD